MYEWAALSQDPACERAFSALADELGEFDRSTGRGGMLIYIPEASDEPTVVVVNGRLVNYEDITNERGSLEDITAQGVRRRFQPTDEEHRERDQRMSSAGTPT